MLAGGFDALETGKNLLNRIDHDFKTSITSSMLRARM